MKAKPAVLLAAALLVAAMASGTWLVGNAYAQEPTNAVQDFTGMITAVGILVGSVSGLVSLVISKVLAAKGDNATLRKIAQGADYLAGTDEGVVEAKQDIATVVEVLANMNPNFKAALEKHNTSVNSIRRRAEEYTQDVERLKAVANKYG